MAMAMVICVPLLGTSAVASAKPAKGCHKSHSCASGGSTGGGAAADPPTIVVTASPNPLVEFGPSYVAAVIQVETNPSLAGDVVNVSSSQLEAACGGSIFFYPLASGFPILQSVDNVNIVLDDDGNASIMMEGFGCAPGSSVIEADLTSAPYYTALTTLVANPPVVTPAGVTGYPNPEVETGDTSTGVNGPSGDSDVYAIFYVEDNPVYAEQPVEIGASQLEASCGGGWDWSVPDVSALTGIGVNLGTEPTGTLDDDGNAVFTFQGISCAAGTYDVIADVEAGSHDTFVTTYTVSPPTPTI
jgi:hypothetical protein